jgi:hypothetical protein
MVNIFAQGPAPQTGPQLARLFNVIAFHSQNAVVFDMQPQGASAAAVKGGCGSNDSDARIAAVVL